MLSQTALRDLGVISKEFPKIGQFEGTVQKGEGMDMIQTGMFGGKYIAPEVEPQPVLEQSKDQEVWAQSCHGKHGDGWVPPQEEESAKDTQHQPVEVHTVEAQSARKLDTLPSSADHQDQLAASRRESMLSPRTWASCTIPSTPAPTSVRSRCQPRP